MIMFFALRTVHGVLCAAFQFGVATPKAHVAHNHIVGLNGEGVIANADPIARRGLSGNGQVAVFHFQRLLQRNGAGNGKHDGARAFLL